MTPEQKQIKNILSNQTDIFPDKITCKKDGNVEVRRSYYYPNGMTASDWTNKVVDVLTAAGMKVIAYGRDEYAHWPSTSYFCAVIYALQ